MNIKTITCHQVYNYGASLQAYALQTYLESQGHTVQIIDFRPDFLCTRYNIFFIGPSSKCGKLAKKIPLLKYILGPIANRYAIMTYNRKLQFDHFTRKYLHTTSIVYHTSEELVQNPPLADLYIAGSDQIWNTNCQNGREPAFYLHFVKDYSKKASYAASFGISEIAKKYSDFVKEMLRQIKYISVREKTGLQILHDLGVEGRIVLDPVFLLSKEEWEHLLPKKINEKYVLVYDFVHDDRNLKELALKSARENGWRIYSINDYSSLDYADKNISNAGPIKFLNYLRSAQLIISSSFHATAFSILFQKQFYVFEVKRNRNSSRMLDLLGTFGLQNRFINRLEDSFTIEPIKYDKKMCVTLNEQIEKSKAFIQEITNCKCVEK